MGGGEDAPRRDRLLILFRESFFKGNIDELKKKHPNTHIELHEYSGDARNIPKEIYRDITILCTSGALPISLTDCPQLEWVQFTSAGVDNAVTHPIYTDSTITITTASGIHGPQIAEWVIMTALTQAHSYDIFHEQQKRREWNPRHAHDHPVRDLAGQRIGILGYGSIGRQVGRVAKAMGMTVLAFTATPKDTQEKRRDGGYIVPGTGDADGSVPAEWYSGLDRESLHNFLRQDIDVLVVCVPLTKETRQLLSAPEFAVLSSRAPLLANISRGPTVHTPSLVAALQSGQLRAACLDVTDPEPLPADSELWAMGNVVVTPHVSGMVGGYAGRAVDVLDLNLGRWSEGGGGKKEREGRLVNVVRRGRGY